MPTQLDLVKRALAQIGTRTTITSLAGTEPEAVYANLLYTPLRDFLLREGDYDFATDIADAVSAGTPPAPWSYSYEYPADAIRIRQLFPVTYNPLDPKPIEFLIHDSTNKQIFTREQVIRIIYTASTVTENNMDPLFIEAFVRLLSSSLAFALQNRIEASQIKLEESITFAGIANLRVG